MLANPKQRGLRDSAIARLDAERKLKPRKRNYAKRKVKKGTAGNRRMPVGGGATHNRRS